MSIQEIKQHIAQLSHAEQDDLRQYIDMLQSNETVLDPLPVLVWKEVAIRATAVENGTMKTSPAEDVMVDLRERVSK